MKRLLSLALMLSMGIFSTYAAEKNDSISENSNTSQTASINNSKFVVQTPKKEESTTSAIYGDVNGDYKIDIVDVVLYNYVLNNSDLSNISYIEANMYGHHSRKYPNLLDFKDVVTLALKQ